MCILIKYIHHAYKSFERYSEKAGHYKTPENPQANYYHFTNTAIAGQEAQLLSQQDTVGSMLISLLSLP